jgi:hypothetical protein
LAPFQQKTFVADNLVFQLIDGRRCENPVQNNFFTKLIINIKVNSANQSFQKISGDIFAQYRLACIRL